jgi:hypothetical protein
MIDAVLGYLRHRKRNYQRVFSGQDADYVLQDLAKFCRAERSCFNPDARMQALLEGRREVWLRIKHHLNLTEEELKEIYAKGRV